MSQAGTAVKRNGITSHTAGHTNS